MKKLLLTIIYPIWFFFGKTWLGNMLMIPTVLLIPPTLIFIIFPELGSIRGEQAEGIGVGVAIFSLLCSPFIGMGFMKISDYLEDSYRDYNYKTEMEREF